MTHPRLPSSVAIAAAAAAAAAVLVVSGSKGGFCGRV